VYTQRTKRRDQSFHPTGRWWTPVVEDADSRRLPVQPQAGDAYVAVDEILEDRVRLVVAPWPRLDEDRRLHFEDLGRRLGPYAPSTLQALVDRHRAQQGQVQRPLRVGDAFLVRGVAHRLSGWQYVLDVTAGARVAAKFAMARAVTPVSQVRARPKRRRRGGSQGQTGPQARQQPERIAGSIALPTV
jgi:hypothetical protein